MSTRHLPALVIWCGLLTLAVWVSMWIAVQAHYRIRDLEKIVHRLQHEEAVRLPKP